MIKINISMLLLILLILHFSGNTLQGCSLAERDYTASEFRQQYLQSLTISF